MKRRIGFAALALVMSVPAAALPASAQAASPDPARAVERQFRPGRGVELTEVARSSAGDEPSSFTFRSRGRIQFGSPGPVASDSTLRMDPTPEARKNLENDLGEGFLSGLFDPEDRIVVKNRLHTSGGVYGSVLPAGKSWLRMKQPARATDLGIQPINVFDPAVLRSLLKDSSGKPFSGGRFYRGTVSRAELRRTAGTTHGSTPAAGGKAKISWRLWTDAAGLPSRMSTVESVGKGKISMTFRTDTRYTGWGSAVVVLPPPADQVIDEEDLPGDLPEYKEPVDTLSSLSRRG
ncbi:hypothetical protein Ppa06_11960 [Planomonospora parontospora subsp. parontospora]|uniref:Uncharacterized protein n=2 Tax=Planomonospora parontospora TaxID=58119 RepID=A0AA37BDP5_9ACTN|nr:hypothetical protein [Planomonospora parontospora]GGK55338.1 hypothetical protein GCM10010126_13620 [Planomonospora parontospora]GII07398.1 hypothetical protein Ppa06_11960 [Planomonospora parontospora subsp. parontospora]